MKRKLVYFAVMFAAITCYLFYFYTFTRSDASDLYLTVSEGRSSEWDISVIEDGNEAPATAAEAVTCEGTAILRRTIPEEWTQYSRVSIDTGRAICVFVDHELVFSNHKTDLDQPAPMPLMQQPEGQPNHLVFSFQPDWVGKDLTVVTRLYEDQPSGKISIGFIDDNTALFEHEAWVNSRALPGGIFGLLSLLLFGLFLFQLAAGQKDYSTLLLALAAGMQMMIHMGYLNENPFPEIDYAFATAIYFILPLLYLGGKLTTMKKHYFITVISLWCFYFVIFAGVFTFQLPLPYWFDRAEVLCLGLIPIMLYYCIKEYKHNLFVRHYLIVLGAFCVGYLLIFTITAVVNQYLHDYIKIIFIEAFALYPRPLLFWVFTTVLFVLFILSLWDVLQSRLRKQEELNELTLHNSLMAQSLDHAEHTNQALAIMRHDEIHHLRALAGFLAEDTEKAREYVDSLAKTLEQIPVMRFTQNKLINSILSAQSASALKKGVELTAIAKIEQDLPLPVQDVTTVLMNLLDNAAAAAAKAAPEEGKPAVSILLEQDSNMLYITVSNSIPADFDRQAFYAALHGKVKSNNSRHGFGIRSVQNILSNYGAELNCVINDSEITIKTVMQFPDKAY